jgi:hypothetical protein
MLAHSAARISGVSNVSRMSRYSFDEDQGLESEAEKVLAHTLELLTQACFEEVPLELLPITKVSRYATHTTSYAEHCREWSSAFPHLRVCGVGLADGQGSQSLEQEWKLHRAQSSGSAGDLSDVWSHSHNPTRSPSVASHSDREAQRKLSLRRKQELTVIPFVCSDTLGVQGAGVLLAERGGGVEGEEEEVLAQHGAYEEVLAVDSSGQGSEAEAANAALVRECEEELFSHVWQGVAQRLLSNLEQIIASTACVGGSIQGRSGRSSRASSSLNSSRVIWKATDDLDSESELSSTSSRASGSRLSGSFYSDSGELGEGGGGGSARVKREFSLKLPSSSSPSSQHSEYSGAPESSPAKARAPSSSSSSSPSFATPVASALAQPPTTHGLAGLAGQSLTFRSLQGGDRDMGMRPKRVANMNPPMHVHGTRPSTVQPSKSMAYARTRRSSKQQDQFLRSPSKLKLTTGSFLDRVLLPSVQNRGLSVSYSLNNNRKAPVLLRGKRANTRSRAQNPRVAQVPLRPFSNHDILPRKRRQPQHPHQPQPQPQQPQPQPQQPQQSARRFVHNNAPRPKTSHINGRYKASTHSLALGKNSRARRHPKQGMLSLPSISVQRYGGKTKRSVQGPSASARSGSMVMDNIMHTISSSALQSHPAVLYSPYEHYPKHISTGARNNKRGVSAYRHQSSASFVI